MLLAGVIFLFLTGWENMQYNQRRKSAWNGSNAVPSRL